MNGEQIGYYINALRETRGREREAARMVGIDFKEVVQERAANEEFRLMEQDVMADLVEVLNKAMWERAVDGIDKGVYSKGELVGVEKHYSDSLLLALAKKHDPGFTEKRVVSGENGGPIQVRIQDFSGMDTAATESAIRTVAATD